MCDFSTVTQHLHTTGNNIGASSVEIGKALEVNTSLQALHISSSECKSVLSTQTGNHIDGSGGESIGKALQLNTTIRLLDISGSVSYINKN